MINNDVLRSVRYMLDLSDGKVMEIINLAGLDIAKSTVVDCLKKETDEGYQTCNDEALLKFLDGLIIFMRGKDETRPPPPAEKRVTNNIVMKKLRVAFEMKEEHLHGVLQLAGFPVSKPELSAVFRKPGHHNYRECGDQLLRNFLKGLTLHLRGEP